MYNKSYVATNLPQNPPPGFRHTEATVPAAFWSSSGSPCSGVSLLHCHGCFGLLNQFRAFTFGEACLRDWPMASAPDSSSVLSAASDQDCHPLCEPRTACWSCLALQCSVSCGVGVTHRSVQCLTNEDQPSHLCPPDLKPEEQKTCHNTYNCK